MPELPEVETVVNDIHPQLINQVISEFKIINKRTVKVDNKIINQKVIKVFRRAKYIIIQLSSSFLVFHLRMTGRILFKNPEKHVIFFLKFKSGKELFFKDIRKFGTVELYKDLEILEDKLGVEPLSKDFNFNYIKKLCKKKQIIKSFLLDQKNIAGIGNIYADEILWGIGVDPRRLVNSLKDEEIRKLILITKQTLKKAIKFNGTTFINFQYGEKEIGSYAKYLNVFTKDGHECKRCNNKLIKIKVAQRGTYLCANCQK